MNQVLMVQANSKLVGPATSIPFNATRAESQDRPLATQQAAPVELVMLSQPWGPNDISHYQNYVYDSTRRQDTYIYHAELGINKQHEDFQFQQGRRIEWLYTQRQLELGDGPTESEAPDSDGHSTCTASKAAGRIYGAARQATLVVVKMPDLNVASLVEIFLTIDRDIRYKNRQNRSVVTISWASTLQVTYPLRPIDVAWNTMLRRLRGLSRMNVQIVTAAGNNAEKRYAFTRRHRLKVDTAPASFKGDSTWPLIVAGNCDRNGRRWPESQIIGRTDYPQIYAQGVDIQCASHLSAAGFNTRTGTSVCQYCLREFWIIADVASRGTAGWSFGRSDGG